MERFAAGEIDVLVSTTVHEVTVECPQCHCHDGQCRALRTGPTSSARGRVGRGKAQSFCIMVNETAVRIPWNGWIL